MAIGFFDGNKENASPESIKRKRAMIARLMQTGRAPRDVGEGLNAIGQGLQAAVLGSRADNAERQVNASSAEAFRNIYSGFGSPTASAGNPVATGSATGSGATRVSRGGPVDPAVVDGIIATAQGLGVDPAHLLTSVSYETGGTFNPKQLGPRTQWGQHKGLIQFGEPQAKQHGVDWNNPIGSQLGPNGAIASYLRSTGVRPGMGLLDIYSAINAGGVGRYNRSDANNGGAPGTVRDKVEQQMAGHRARAMALLQERYARPVQTASAGPQSNDAQMQDGAGELQAGGSEMMGGGYNPFLPRDMAPTADAMGQGIADNEEQTRMMEAQMAAEQGLPYAGNEPGQFNSMLSPDPMGGGLNPFVPRDMVQPEGAIAQAPAPMPPQMDRATFDAITGQMPPAPSMDRRNFDQITNTGAPLNPAFTGQQAGLAPSWGIGDPNAPPPSAQEVSGPAPGPFPTPPRRPANIAPPQSPFVRQPIAPMEAGENSGGAMQFIESEFARREGRPDPRSAVGAPQGYSPFVQQPTQAPQMPAGGGSVQGVSQGDTMAGSPAQAPAQASSRIAYLASVAGNSMNNPEVRQLAMAEIQTERARAQADADRARVQAQNEAAADALGVDRRLAGNQSVFSAAAAAKLGNRTENIPATVAVREAEGRRLGLQGPALQQFALTGQLPNAAISENKIAAETKAREAEAARIGLKPGDPRYTNFVLTGKMPREDAQPLSATDKKAILEADEGVLAGETAIKSLNDAKALSPRAMSGYGTSARAAIGNRLPDWLVPDIIAGKQASQDTSVYENIVLGQALSQLKSIFGAAPTEGERQILMKLQASVDEPDNVRQPILDTAISLAEKRLAFNRQRAAELRGGDFYKPEDKRGQPSRQTNAPAQGSKVLRYNPKTGALE